MNRTVQIAPGVLFSADVLSPEWGREFRGDAVAGQAVRDAQPARRSGRACEEGECGTRESNGDQMSLL